MKKREKKKKSGARHGIVDVLACPPICTFHYELVVGKGGKVEKWAWETGGANALYRRGWRKEDLVAGTMLVIDGYQARNGSNTANATSITFENGKRLFAASSSQGGASGQK